MVDLNDNLGFIGVQRIEVSDIALGGNEINAPNLQLKQLASRDLYLKNLIAPDVNAQNTLTQFQAVGIAAIAQGRLTLATGTPDPSSDLLAQTTLYYTPHIGDYISLWNSTVSRWEAFQFTQRSLSLTGLAANTNFDIFIFSNAGTLTLEAVAWSNSGAGTSARASAISRRNGVWVKTSDNRRYLGTIRTTGTTGQCEDSQLQRFVWNVQNRVTRNMGFSASGSSYSYTTASYRPLANSTNWQLRVVDGLGGLGCNPMLSWETSTDGTGGTQGSPGIGLNSTVNNSAQAVSTRPGVNDQVGLTAIGALSTSLGYNFFQFLEFGGPGIIVQIAVSGMGMLWSY